MSSQNTSEAADTGSALRTSGTVTLQPYYLAHTHTFDIIPSPCESESHQDIASQVYDAALRLQGDNAPGSYREWDSLVRQVALCNPVAQAGGQYFALTVKPIVTVASAGTDVYENEQQKKRTAWATETVGWVNTYYSDEYGFDTAVPSFDASTMPGSSEATQGELQANLDSIQARAALYIGTDAEKAVKRRLAHEGAQSALRNYSTRVKGAAKDLMAFSGQPMRIEVIGNLLEDAGTSAGRSR